MIQNAYVSQLLALQQDGSQAISSPANWLADPLLSVDSEAMQAAHALAEDLASSKQGGAVRWHFYAGSPGNGKSAATGAFARSLVKNHSYVIRARNGRLLQDITDGLVPFVLEVCDPVTSEVIAFIAQDASVVRDPFSEAPDPASDFLDLLVEAHERVVGLVACTNRGILERAARLAAQRQIPDGLVDVLSEIAACGQKDVDALNLPLKSGSSARAFSSIVVSSSALDTRSLMFPGEGGSFASLVEQATHGEHWQPCSGCHASKVCPFFQNRNFLANVELRQPVMRLLQDAELLSGQLLVFREANALISLLMAGCPADYQSQSPCEWVISKLNDGDLFSLAARRIHMALFSAYAPLGFESEPDSAQDQVTHLRNVVERIDHGVKFILPADESFPSTNVGLPRLLARTGVLAMLDPLSRPLSRGFAEQWENEFVRDAVQLSDLEVMCQSIWSTVADAIEQGDAGSRLEAAALSRWRSSHTIRFGALVSGKYSFRRELDIYRRAIGIDGFLDAKEKARIRSEVESILRRGEKGVPISEAVLLSETWVRLNIRPVIEWILSAAQKKLVLRFSSKEVVCLSARAFAWLNLKESTGLSANTFPDSWVEASKEALGRAAASSQYSRAEGVRLEIRKPSGERFLMVRDEPGQTYLEACDE